MSIAQVSGCSDCSNKPNSSLRTTIRTIAILLAISFLAITASAQTVTVWTDKVDYPPGDSVVIYGEGFWAGESIEILVTHYNSSTPDTGDGHIPWNIVADANGDFETYWIIPYDDHLDEVLLVTATGLSSGLIGTTTFADASTILYLSDYLPDSVCSNYDSLDICAILEEQCGGSGFASLEGRELIFFFSNSSCGVDVAQTGEDTVYTDANGEACGRLAIPSTPGEYRIRVKYLGESKPGLGDPPNSACNPNQRVQLSNANVCEPMFVDPAACCEVTISCPADIALECDQSTDPANTGTATFSGTCSGIAISYTDAIIPGYCINSYTITRTWIASDGDQNADTCVQTITLTDTTAPVLTGCPADVTVACDAIPSAAAVTATDNCDVAPTVVMTESEVAGACANAKIITRTWTATDECSNVSVCTQIITVEDNIAPVLAGCPADVTVECSAIPAAATVTATDNCDAAPVVVMTESEVAGACADAKTITRTWTATDACGNSSSCTQTIIVEDNTAPVLAGCPADVTVECDAIPPAAATVTATDLCDASPVITFNETETAGICANEKTITRTWTATDACGNSSQCSQTITVDDSIAPVLAGCPTDVTVECDAIPAAATSVTATDNCDAAPSIVMTETEVAGACGDAKTITRTWTATDACGNSSSCTQTITVEDNTAPVLASCPADISVECDAIPDAPTLTATDNCDVAPTVVMTESEVAGACGDAKTITRTWTATDACGNSSSCAQTIIVEDNSAPVLAGCPTDVTVECDAIPSAASVTATDNCDVAPTVVMTASEVAGACANAKTITRTWTATDACGNSSSCSQVITVEDNSAPVLAGCPTDITVECDAIPSAATVTATDNCDVSVSVSFSETEVAGACANAKTITRTWTATDACGNSSACTQTIIVEDNTAPVLAGCPTDISVDCSSIPSAATVTATDNCDLSVSVVFNESEVAGACATSRIITRTWTATDACGNSAVCTQLITIEDITAPVLAGCPADATVECDAIPAAATVTATDNCDGSVSVSFSETEVAGACANSKTITRSWTATDLCGNEASCTQIIEVADNTAPVCSVPNDTTISFCEATQVCLPVSCSDNCDASPTSVVVSGPGAIVNGEWCYTPTTSGVAAVTVRCEDACGNFCEATFNVTFDINEAPVCTVPNNQTFSQCSPTQVCLPVSCSDPDGNLLANQPTIISGPGAIVNGEWCYTPAGPETAIVTVQCEDDCGAICQSSFEIIFEVNSAPVCTVPDDQTIFLCDPTQVCLPVGCSDIDGNLLANQPTIISGPGTIVNGEWCYSPAADEVVVITVLCEDDCGLTCESTFTITFDLNEKPLCQVPNDSTINLCEPTEVCLPVGCTDADNNLAAGSPVLKYGPGAIVNGNWCYTPQASETAVVTIECIDECGATSECTFSVEFVVNSSPVIVDCPGDLTFPWLGSNISETITATDADGNETITFTLGDGSPGAVDATTGIFTWNTSGSSVCGGDVTVIATDDCGLADTCTFNICITNEPPVIACSNPDEVCWGSTVTGQPEANDPDGGPINLFYSLHSFDGPGTVTVDGATGEYTWETSQSPEFAGTFELCILVTDNAELCEPCSPSNADTCCVSITIVPAYRVHIEKTHGTLQGHTVEVDVYLDSSIVYSDMGGFNFLLGYDASALTFMGATEGSLLIDCGWEYFTYRFGANGNCGTGCPSGEIRLVAIAETNNGGNHPTCRSNDGVSSQLAQLIFMVTNDRTLECSYVPIRFRWYECTDNTLSSPGGDTLYLASAVYDWSGTDGQDAWIDITNTTEAFPTYTGAHFSCDDGSDPSAKVAPQRCLEFFNGGVDIICADSIDARGDINLDGIGYTIADAVMFVNYFVYGLQAFIDIADTNSYGFAPGHEGSIAASDVNADGLALTVSDMVYLIRVVVGDALPYPKVTPLNVETSYANGILSVERSMGAAYLLVKGEVIPELLATNVDMKFEYDGTNTRIIVFSYGQESFQGEFLALEGEVLVLEMATYDGQPTMTNLMPSTFSLIQNYPNPFNPSTTISFELPKASHVKLEIFNVQGRLVTTLIDERYEAGTHEYRWEAGSNSSGIYMYRLVTDRLIETKKMILLK